MITLMTQFMTILILLAQLAPHPAMASELTALDLAKHSSPEDCWIAIEGKVYDITSYIPKHPAPATALTKYCGKDATTGWKTKDKGKPHTRSAERLLQRYEKGTIDFSK